MIDPLCYVSYFDAKAAFDSALSRFMTSQNSSARGRAVEALRRIGQYPNPESDEHRALRAHAMIYYALGCAILSDVGGQ
jgi:hypothetical protein